MEICRMEFSGKGLEARLLALCADFDALAAEVHQVMEQEITRQVLDAATAMTNRRAVRSLDAIQLGSAIVVGELFSRSEMRLLASDHEL